MATEDFAMMKPLFFLKPLPPPEIITPNEYYPQEKILAVMLNSVVVTKRKLTDFLP